MLSVAHCHPDLGNETHHPANGLLLRADLHALFDCGLLSIAPVETGGFSVQIAPPPAPRQNEVVPVGANQFPVNSSAGSRDGRPVQRLIGALT